MAERVKVTVRASGAHPDVLTILDAMRQVLDFFQLLAKEGEPGIEWRLSKASTNSPFYIVGEAVSLHAGVDVTVVARSQKQALEHSLRDIVSNRLPIDPLFDIKIAKRFFERNTNGIGVTEIDFETGDIIKVTPQVARQAVETIVRQPENALYEFVRPTEEVGSIEGTLFYVGTHRKAPAVQIIDSRTKEKVWCRLSAELERSFDGKTTFDDVWKHRRVRIRGRIKYKDDGAIDYVLSSDITKIVERQVSLDEIQDREFTGGLSVVEYLDRFRDGSLG
ncbi:MAG: hypothetical protein IOC82_01485 [Aestuariivirga sp.]|uniref:hypothetical protein n=1 Tax=Aestuariivirga sp. TaxID=2650926 RepID=UPI0025BA2D38|nr:hypothetical protein [Aestuariivirga sp.]MCA3559685.1 hypothetical protein [Aestuariivirga sp.]